MKPRNLQMPGSPRLQPKDLIPYFGHDNTYRGLGQVEIANLQVLGEVGVIPPEIIRLLTRGLRRKVLAIRATLVDETERRDTKHDVRAWVREAQKIMPAELGLYLHALLTSYDALDTGRIYQYHVAYRDVIRGKILSVIVALADVTEREAGQIQIGRTHGQHALPITVGFWLATTLSRVMYNFEQMELYDAGLVGKISGAVGAYNAQVGLGIAEKCADGPTYEERVLDKLGLKPAPISTQILPPEPLAYFLHAATLLSASFGQLGRDIRNLMRSEIGEIVEARSKGQVGSSTMAGKANPINAEGMEGDAINDKVEYLRVLETLISEHQRDLTGSRPARMFPAILVNLCSQLDTLLRGSDSGQTFLHRLQVNPSRCEVNLKMGGSAILGEPLYIALLMAGYQGDAHQLVNDVIVPGAKRTGRSLIGVLADLEDNQAQEALSAMSSDVISLLEHPDCYIGSAREKALETASRARQLVQELLGQFAM